MAPCAPRYRACSCLAIGNGWRRATPARGATGCRAQRSLTVSGLDWTLVEVPSLPAGLRIDDFSRAGDVAEVEAARMFACAEALLDEVRLGLHKRQCLRLAP